MSAILTVRYRLAGTLSPELRDRWNALLLAAALRGLVLSHGDGRGAATWYCARVEAAEARRWLASRGLRGWAPAPALLTAADVAARCGVSLDVVYRLLDEGEIPARRIGRQWRVHPEELDAWLRGDRRDEHGTPSASLTAADSGGRTSPGEGEGESASPSGSRSPTSRTTRRTASPPRASGQVLSLRDRLKAAAKR